MSSSFKEITDLLSWMGSPKRNKIQLNALNTSDCELLKISNKQTLALTIDTISDEIDVGLYKTAETIGWMTATSSLSDLTAVGANPLGLLLSTNWKNQTELAFKKEFMNGFHQALKLSKTFLIGGDNGASKAPVFSSVGVGMIDGTPLTRKGLKPGDHIALISAKDLLGIGPALGFKLLLNSSSSDIREEMYRPVPPLLKIQKIKKYLTAAIDTSDGIMTSLYTLSKLNNVSFQLRLDPQLFHEKALAFCRQENLPISSLAFGEHGDYQVLCGIKPKYLNVVKKNIKGLKLLGLAQGPKLGHKMYNKDDRLVDVNIGLSQGYDMRDLYQIRDAFEHMVRECRRLNLN